MKILIIEDDAQIAAVISRGLQKHGYSTETAEDGEEGVFLARSGDYHLVVLDVMLPYKDGFEVCRELRSSGIQVPILMLTARDSIQDRVAGLDVGADDYLIKPFEFLELLARVRALLRRRPDLSSDLLRIGDLTLDRNSRSATRGQRFIELTTKEFALLEFLMDHTDHVVNRYQIGEYVWDRDFDPVSNVIDVYIKRLRQKVDGKGESPMIRTMRGSGYVLRSSTTDD